MSGSRHPLPGTPMLWLVIGVMIPAACFAGTAETLPETPTQGLMSKPLDLRVRPPIDLRF
jgi:hypothetical protein